MRNEEIFLILVLLSFLGSIFIWADHRLNNSLEREGGLKEAEVFIISLFLFWSFYPCNSYNTFLLFYYLIYKITVKSILTNNIV